VFMAESEHCLPNTSLVGTVEGLPVNCFLHHLHSKIRSLILLLCAPRLLMVVISCVSLMRTKVWQIDCLQSPIV
jgi:hypothetical protein